MKKIFFIFVFFLSVTSYSKVIDKDLFVKDYALIGISSDEKKIYNTIGKFFTKNKFNEIKNSIEQGITKEFKMTISELKKRIKLASDYLYVGINIKNDNNLFIVLVSEEPENSINSIIDIMRGKNKNKIKVEVIDNIHIVKNNNIVEMVYIIDKNKIIIAPQSSIINEYINNKQEPDNKIIDLTSNPIGFIYIGELVEKFDIEKPVMIRFEADSEFKIVARSSEKEEIKPIPIQIKSPLFSFILPLNKNIKKMLFSGLEPQQEELKDLIGDQFFIVVNDFDYQGLMNNVYNSLDFILGIKINNQNRVIEFLMKNSQGMLQPINKPYPAYTLLLPGVMMNVSIQQDYLLVSPRDFNVANYTSKRFLFVDFQRLINKVPPLKEQIVNIGINPNIKSIEGYVEDSSYYQEAIIVIK
ncbi:MAG TPA: hypothetical protein PKW55_05380 [Spirochaetota bacterium]|nr:hypothetical protein [Spirochaetota bacterium]HOM37616.1 hypothetical protein [Spirochaetota bacterium]HPQ49413.1 hypothetical protein [Spirochaetota bacterium]